MERHYDDLSLDFKDYNQLSYEDDGQSAFVKIYLDNVPNAFSKVFTDRENGAREYVCINYEMIYLDTLNKVN